MKQIWTSIGALVIYGLFLAGIFLMFKKFMAKMVDAADEARSAGLGMS